MRHREEKDKKKKEQEMDRIIILLLCMVLNSCVQQNIWSTTAKYGWSLKWQRERRRKRNEWHIFMFQFLTRSVTAFHLPRLRKTSLPPPWKTALSETVDKWTALIVLIISAHVCSWLALKLIWGMKLNHPHIKPVQREERHCFKKPFFILMLRKRFLEYMMLSCNAGVERQLICEEQAVFN